MKLASLFAVPVAEARLDAADPLPAQLRDLFLAREAEGEKYRNETRRDTQHGDLFESRFDLFKWPEPPIRKLTEFCHRNVTALVSQISNQPRPLLESLQFEYHTWFHITRRGGYQGLHNHQNASWSGIFCVDPGDSPADSPQSGAVRFHDPRGMADMYSDAANRNLSLPWHHGTFQIQHEVGKLLIFPSYLMHEIFPYEGERPRIVVAFNCWTRIGSPG